jgi:pentapeptide MXKDX repeat protein
MSGPESLEANAQRALLAAVAACTVALATSTGALADDPPRAGNAKSNPMNMNKPMAGEMKKEGMKKGKVTKTAERKDAEIRKMPQEEKRSAGTVKS